MLIECSVDGHVIVIVCHIDAQQLGACGFACHSSSCRSRGANHSSISFADACGPCGTRCLKFLESYGVIAFVTSFHRWIVRWNKSCYGSTDGPGCADLFQVGIDIFSTESKIALEFFSDLGKLLKVSFRPCEEEQFGNLIRQ